MVTVYPVVPLHPSQGMPFTILFDICCTLYHLGHGEPGWKLCSSREYFPSHVGDGSGCDEINYIPFDGRYGFFADVKLEETVLVKYYTETHFSQNLYSREQDDITFVEGRCW